MTIDALLLPLGLESEIFIPDPGRYFRGRADHVILIRYSAKLEELDGNWPNCQSCQSIVKYQG